MIIYVACFYSSDNLYSHFTQSELRGIHNARKGGEKPVANVFCAVLGFSSPTMSRGYDYQVNVTLVDDSLPLPTAGEDDVVAATPIIIFCKEKDNLPQILKAGDVLRLHRVAVQVCFFVAYIDRFKVPS